MATEFWLSERQCKRLAPLSPRKSRGVPRVDNRRVISGIVHVLESGGRWVDAPAVYGRARPSTTGSFAGVPPGYGSTCFGRSQRQADLLPSFSSTAHTSRSTAALPEKRGAKSRPLALAATAPPRLTPGPIASGACFLPYAGYVADCRAAEGLLHGLPHNALVMADRAYDTNAIRHPPADRTAGRSSEHPAYAHPDLEKLLQPRALSPPQRHRAHVLSAEGLPQDRYPLRQERD